MWTRVILRFGTPTTMGSSTLWNSFRVSRFFPKPNTKTRSDVLSHVVLYDIFDLNEIDSLNGVDIEFMFYSCILSCYKIFNVGEEND
jgi:hypothetical protein